MKGIGTSLQRVSVSEWAGCDAIIGGRAFTMLGKGVQLWAGVGVAPLASRLRPTARWRRHPSPVRPAAALPPARAPRRVRRLYIDGIVFAPVIWCWPPLLCE